GQKIVHCGDVGAGDTVKAMNQALLAIHIWSAGEALVTLVKEGVRPNVALDVINASSGRSNSSMNLFPERVLTRAFPRTFRLALTTLAAASAVAGVDDIRAQFPAMERTHAGAPVAYFDGPGGTQVPAQVVDAMSDYLLCHNANTHWRYPTSEETDALIAASRE